MYLGENVLFVTVMISLILVIIINIKTREYICNNCKHRFSIKFHQIISFHAGNYRKLKCPVCGAVTLGEEVNKYKNDKFNSVKKISYEYHVNDVKINWVDNDTVIINGHKIDLPDGKYESMSSK